MEKEKTPEWKGRETMSKEDKKKIKDFFTWLSNQNYAFFASVGARDDILTGINGYHKDLCKTMASVIEQDDAFSNVVHSSLTLCMERLFSKNIGDAPEKMN